MEGDNDYGDGETDVLGKVVEENGWWGTNLWLQGEEGIELNKGWVWYQHCKWIRKQTSPRWKKHSHKELKENFINSKMF